MCFEHSGIALQFTTEVLQQLKEKALTRAELTEGDIVQMIEERIFARKNKDFSRGDQIRSDLAAKGIALVDVGKETVWRPCVRVEQAQDGKEQQGPTSSANELKNEQSYFQFGILSYANSHVREFSCRRACIGSTLILYATISVLM